MPLGNDEVLNETGLLNEAMEVIVTVSRSEAPPPIVIAYELSSNEKSGEVVKMKLATAKSPTWSPVTLTGYVPGVKLATVNVPVNAPPDTEQL